jgi:hypothetical protein
MSGWPGSYLGDRSAVVPSLCFRQLPATQDIRNLHNSSSPNHDPLRRHDHVLSTGPNGVRELEAPSLALRRARESCGASHATSLELGRGRQRQQRPATPTTTTTRTTARATWTAIPRAIATWRREKLRGGEEQPAAAAVAIRKGAASRRHWCRPKRPDRCLLPRPQAAAREQHRHIRGQRPRRRLAAV